MPQVGFEPTISAGERPQTYALDRAATGIGIQCGFTLLKQQKKKKKIFSAIKVKNLLTNLVTRFQ